MTLHDYKLICPSYLLNWGFVASPTRLERVTRY
jgi:hypothetical protein